MNLLSWSDYPHLEVLILDWGSQLFKNINGTPIRVTSLSHLWTETISSFCRTAKRSMVFQYRYSITTAKRSMVVHYRSSILLFLCCWKQKANRSMVFHCRHSNINMLVFLLATNNTGHGFSLSISKNQLLSDVFGNQQKKGRWFFIIDIQTLQGLLTFYCTTQNCQWLSLIVIKNE